MSTQATVFEDAGRPAYNTEARAISPLQLFRWSVERELWDNHSLFIAPATVGALVLLGFFFGPFGLKHMATMDTTPGSQDWFALRVAYDVASGMIMAVAFVVSVFYAVDALYAERRDRSILFWKSLPVSDLIAVLAKASIPMLVLPLITFAIAVVVHLLMAISTTVMLLRLGQPVGAFWSQLAIPQMWGWLLFHLVTVSALWYAPFYGWLLFVSAWARRAPFLAAFLPPIALSALEVVIFHTTYIGEQFKHRLAQGNIHFTSATQGNTYLPAGVRVPAQASFATAEFWLGLLVAVLLLAAAVRLRRYKGAL